MRKCIYILGFFVLLGGFASAQLPVSGNANQDDRLDVADVVTLTETNNSTATLSAIDSLFADANQDVAVDDLDTDYVADIILGRVFALPLGGLPIQAGVSFWFQDQVTSGTIDETVVLPAAASFWFQEEPANVMIDETAVLPAAASFWFMETAPAAMEDNAVQLGTPSFDRQ